MKTETDEVVNQDWDDEEDISLWALAAMVLRKWRVAVVTVILICLVGIPLVFLRAGAPGYTASASFVPQSNSSGRFSGLAGIAAQYGLAVPEGNDPQSPQFYSDLMSSRRILAAVAEHPYRIKTESGQVTQQTLIQFLAPKARNAARAKDDAIAGLKSRLSKSVDRTTGVVRFSVTTPQPELSREIAEQIITELRNYDLSTRQSNAMAERKFVEARLQDQRAQLRRVEENLENFLLHNKQFQSSAELRLAYDRMQRDLVLRQQVVTALTQGFEQARIEEVRNTPVFSLIEVPETPVGANGRGRARNSILLVLISTVIGLGVAFTAAMLERSRENDADSYHEFKSVVGELKRGVSRPFRRAV